MTQQAHDLRSSSVLPHLGTNLVRTVFQFILTVAAVILLDPKSLFIALLATVSSIALTLASNTYLVELDLRLRTHVGALSHFYLDSLLGLIPIRTHGAERIVRREHEAMLVEWAPTGYQVTRASISVTGIQSFVSTLFSVWLLLSYMSSGGSPAGVLLIFFWTLNLPSFGQSLAAFIQDYRLQHNHVLRLLEPPGAPEDTFAAADITNELPTLEQDSLAAPNPGDTGQIDAPVAPGIGIEFEDVSVQAGGNTILSEINLSIGPGDHMAIFGPSGATLIYITHDVNQTETFDRALVIEGGNIVEDAVSGILANNPG